MRLHIIHVLILFMGALPVFGQTVGTTEKSVIEHYGAPQVERDQGSKKIWIYQNGTRIVISNGLVVESNVSASQPAPQRTVEKSPPPRPQEQSRPKVVQPAPTKPEVRTSRDSKRGQPKLNGLGMLIMSLGLLIGFAASIWFIVISFKESILWGLACLFIPLASLVFTIMYWSDAKKPFLISVFICTPLIFLGAFVGTA
ncbi:MAG: hypothetical protein K0R17_2509 [Rariglobus sp.]|jgi:hypothetical protein|nr:hypothetical protein [Rariglobus sp.]